MTDVSVCIILVAYKSYDYTTNCIKSILESSYKSFSIIVVDNDPNSDSVQQWCSRLNNPCIISDLESASCATRSTNLAIILSDKNGGFAYGVNLGIRYAQIKYNFLYIWLLNSDTIVNNETLKELISYSENNCCKIVGSKLVNINSGNIQTYGGGFVSQIFATTHDAKCYASNLDYICGASMLIHFDVIQKIGLMPEEYFLYYEDVDYSFTAAVSNFTLGCAEKSVVMHVDGGITKASDKINRSDFIDILAIKNRIKFAKKFQFNKAGVFLGLLYSAILRLKRKKFRNSLKIIILSFKYIFNI